MSTIRLNGTYGLAGDKGSESLLLHKRPLASTISSMDPNQQPTGLYGQAQTTKSKNTVMYILIGFLAVGTLVFGIMAIVFSGTAHTATTTLNQQKAAAALAARADQQKADAQAADIAAESPFRAYNAPQQYGEFQIMFPKSWNGYVDQEPTSSTQVTLYLHPDFVLKDANFFQFQGCIVLLIQRQLNDYLRQFTSLKGMVQTDTTVDGIKSVKLVGPFPDRRTKVMIVVPVRDKVMVFTNEDPVYTNEFNQILAQATLHP